MFKIVFTMAMILTGCGTGSERVEVVDPEPQQLVVEPINGTNGTDGTDGLNGLPGKSGGTCTLWRQLPLDGHPHEHIEGDECEDVYLECTTMIFED